MKKHIKVKTLTLYLLISDCWCSLKIYLLISLKEKELYHLLCPFPYIGLLVWEPFWDLIDSDSKIFLLWEISATLCLHFYWLLTPGLEKRAEHPFAPAWWVDPSPGAFCLYHFRWVKYLLLLQVCSDTRFLTSHMTTSAEEIGRDLQQTVLCL